MSEAIAAFFDMDLTLVAANTAWLYVRHLRREGYASRRQLARALFWSVRYRLGSIEIDRVYEDAVRSMAGRTEETEYRLAMGCFEAGVRSRISEQGRRTVEGHREQGHRLVVLTGSPIYGAKPVAAALGIEHVISTELEVRDGAFSGRVVPPLCYGQGKVDKALGFARRHGVDLTRSYFYTDSHTDLPMLEAVGHPRAVNPDRRLRREATRRGWPVLRFGRGPRLV